MSRKYCSLSLAIAPLAISPHGLRFTFYVSRHQAPKHRQILLVLGIICALWGFEHFGEAGEALVVHYEAERFQAECALAYVFVAVNPAAQSLLRVVHVDCPQLVEANYAIEVLNHLLVLVLVREVVARRQQMACVPAYADARPRLVTDQ